MKMRPARLFQTVIIGLMTIFGMRLDVAAGESQAVISSSLTVPKLSNAPNIDGDITDVEWSGASSFIALIDGARPEQSLAYPPSNAKFAYDNDYLYVAFSSHFPRESKILKGNPKTDQETDVWSDESFEFYISRGNDVYRFAGNVAGNRTESRNMDNGFNEPWRYGYSLRTQIDDSELWQGEVAIPWKSIGLSAPPEGTALKVNFCRTWRIAENNGTTSLAGSLAYNDVAKFVALTCTSSAPVFQALDHNNPSFGMWKQTIAVSSPVNGTYLYSVSLVNTKGLAQSEKLVDKVVTVSAGKRVTLAVEQKIDKSYFNALEFCFKDESKGQVVMRQTVPFEVSRNYLKITPVFSRNLVIATANVNGLKSTVGPDAQLSLTLKDSGSTVLMSTNIDADGPVSIAFDKSLSEGMYRIALSSAQKGKRTVRSEQEFYYPGIGEYEQPQYDPSKVLPPFTPMRASSKDGKTSIAMWGRDYLWGDGLLPETMTSQGAPLLSSTLALWVDGRPLPAGEIKLTKNSSARCELAGGVQSDKCDVSVKSWIEYDGVLWNDMTVTAKQALSGVTLKFSLPDKIGKYVHAAKGGFGADGGFTGKISAPLHLEFYPVVWLGDEEKGLAWFAETKEGWATANEKPIQIIQENGKTVFSVTFADTLKAGAAMHVSFGMLATPVKPLPRNYPLNTLGAAYPIHHNLKAPRAPTTAIALGMVDARCLSFGFFDLPIDKSGQLPLAELKETVNGYHKNHAQCIPYMQPVNMSADYPVVSANKAEWEMLPQRHLPYRLVSDQSKHELLWLCPASKATAYYLWKVKALVKQSGIDGLYFDFGQVRFCNNNLHGCNGRYPLLAMRDYYRGIANAFVEAGKTEYVLCAHDSQAIQVPVFTFLTHLYNGEHFRQQTSTTFHGGKDILDSLPLAYFATELSGIPWGITSCIYTPTTQLEQRFGGGKEDPELYAFRMSKAFLAGSLIHGTIPAFNYGHFGLLDKVVRIYDGFDVPHAVFMPYWRNEDTFTVVKGVNIHVTAYKHHAERKLLMVVSHVGKDHQDQDVTVSIDPVKLGWRKLVGAENMFARNDPEYGRLASEANRARIPITLGDYGVTLKGLAGNHVDLFLRRHSFAIIEVTGE